MPFDSHHKTGLTRDPGSIIASQIETLTGGRTSVILESERTWASITFAGTRYCFSIEWTDCAETDAMQQLAQALPNHEFIVPGYFVADILATEQTEFRLLVEVLAIIDPIEKRRTY